jgi:hypothetical protein
VIGSDTFTSVFGSAVPGGDDPLLYIARAAIRAGFAVVPNKPGTKQPKCILSAREAKTADTKAREQARAAGHRRPDDVRHVCGVHHAITDEKISDKVFRRFVKDGERPNIGIELGRSRVIVVDVDTVSELEGFISSWSAATADPMPEMTVRSPGVYADETWKHKGGGHYWFSLPDGWVLPAEDGAMKDPSGWIAMWANRQVLVPPSVRAEGPYELVGDMLPAPKWLLQRVLTHIKDRQVRSAEQTERRLARAATGEEASVDVWSTITSWADILEPDDWVATGLPDTCGCEIWTAPGAHASPKSATAHDIGCSIYDFSTGHAPIHIWTDNPPDYLMDWGSKTITKLQFVALRDHGGAGAQAIAMASRALGISREGGSAATLVPLPGVSADIAGPLPSASTAGQGVLPLSEPSASHDQQEALPLGLPIGPPPNPTQAGPGGDQAPADSDASGFDPELERLIRERLQGLFVHGEADKRYTAIRFPYAAKAGERTFRSMAEVLREAADTPAEFLVERWLRKGSYGVLGAQFKAGKTFIAMDMALSVATGGLFLGLVPCTQGNVAIMHNEGDLQEFSERLLAVARFKGIALTEEVLSRLMIQEGATKLDQPESVNRLYTGLKDFDPDLLIIDPWYMSAGDEADGKTLSKMGTVLGNLQGVAAELKCALLITAHWNKSGDGKGVARWSGSGLAEWGRVLINVSVDKFFAAVPYVDDKTGRTKVDLTIDLAGQVSGNYWVHREVWRDDAKDLRSAMHYEVTAREQEDIESDGTEAVRDVTRSNNERLLRVFSAVKEGLTKSKAIDTAQGSRGGRKASLWREAFDELLRAGFIEDIGAVTVTDTEGREKVNPGAKFGITAAGRGEIQRFEESHRVANIDTSKFVPLATTGTTEGENDA